MSADRIPVGEPGARFSEDRKYRYELTRHGLIAGNIRELVACMVNPSTADASRNDPTIDALTGIAIHQKCGVLRVVNLYALVSTDPRFIGKHKDPVGPENDTYIVRAAERVKATEGVLLLAWGSESKTGNWRAFRQRAAHVTRLVDGYEPKALGFCFDGQPWHPLFRARDLALLPVPRRAVL